jgi:DoxX
LAPFVARLEFFGGILLLLGLFTRIIAMPLAVVMVVATIVDKAKDIDSLAAYTDLIETVYMAVFIWLAVAGAGAASLDRLFLQRIRPQAELPAPRADRPDFQRDDQTGAVVDPREEGADPSPPAAAAGPDVVITEPAAGASVPETTPGEENKSKPKVGDY